LSFNLGIKEICMSANNVIGTGGSPAASNPSSSSGNNASENAAGALANGSGADSRQLGSIVDDLKSGIESGNSAQIGQAIGDLIALLKGSAQGKGAAEGGNPASSSGGGQQAGAPADGADEADEADGSSDSEGGNDVLSLLQKLLEALGLPKDQIAKILNQAQESAVGGGENANGATPGGESVSGVKAA
jgi:hypothetical protein